MPFASERCGTGQLSVVGAVGGAPQCGSAFRIFARRILRLSFGDTSLRTKKTMLFSTQTFGGGDAYSAICAGSRSANGCRTRTLACREPFCSDRPRSRSAALMVVLRISADRPARRDTAFLDCSDCGGSGLSAVRSRLTGGKGGQISVLDGEVAEWLKAAVC